MASKSARRRERRRRAAAARGNGTVALATSVNQNNPTPYVATGNIERPAPDSLTEIGVADVTGALREYVPQLVGRTNQIQTYRRMQWNDAQVKAMLALMMTPVLAGQFYVEPASQEQIDLDAQEFVSDNLFNGMTTTWSRTQMEILQMLPYGSSVFETVYEEQMWAPKATQSNRKLFVRLKKLAPRPAWTIKNFLYDANGGPAGVTHRFKDPSNPSGNFVEKDILIDKLLIFTYDQEGGKLDGNSVLRPAYKHWYYKDNFYKIDAVQKERHGIGIPRIKVPPGAPESEKQAARELGRNLRTNEQAEIVQPYGWEIDFVQLEGQLTDALASASTHDVMIMRSVLGQFINSGSGGGDSGGRATAGGQIDMFLKASRHLANYVCDIVNLYLVPYLVGWNFPVNRFPKLRVRRIGEKRELQAWSAALRNAWQAGLLTPTEETENLVRDEFDLPAIDSDTWDKAQKAKEKAAQATQAPAGQGGGQSNTPAKPTAGSKQRGGNTPKAPDQAN
jgi:hypothetical protein